MNLAELQQRMSCFVYTRQPTDEQTAAVMELVDHTRRAAPEDGFRVYRRNLLVGVALELRSTFSRTRQVLGTQRFDDCVRAFLYASDSTARAAQPRGRGLGEVGCDFPAFVRAECAEVAADMADLEWAQEEAFFAPGDEAISESTIRTLLELPAEDIHLCLRTSLALLTPRYPVHREHFEDPEPDLRLAIWRDDGRYRCDEVEPQLWPVTRAIDAGQPLGAIAALPEVEANPELLRECLSVLLIRGWLREPPRSGT